MFKQRYAYNNKYFLAFQSLMYSLMSTLSCWILFYLVFILFIYIYKRIFVLTMQYKFYRFSIFSLSLQKSTLNAVYESQSICFVGLLRVLHIDSMPSLQKQLLRAVASGAQHLTSLWTVQTLQRQTWYVLADTSYRS